MLLNPPTQSNLLSHLRAGRMSQLDLCEIGLDTQDPSSGRRRADVDHQDLSLGQFLHLAIGNESPR